MAEDHEVNHMVAVEEAEGISQFAWTKFKAEPLVKRPRSYSRGLLENSLHSRKNKSGGNLV